MMYIDLSRRHLSASGAGHISIPSGVRDALRPLFLDREMMNGLPKLNSSICSQPSIRPILPRARDEC